MGPDDLQITFVRCATVLLECGGRRLLTDPWFAGRIWFLPCLRRAGLAPGQIPPLDGVLVSHLHVDHFDPVAVRRLRPSPPRVLLPPGSLSRLGGGDPGWEELRPWTRTAIGGIRLMAVPGPHTGPPPDEVAWVASFPGFGPVYFGGDARLDEGVLRRIRDEEGPVRVALLPVGGTRILGRKVTMSPRDAARAADLLGAAAVVPIHEGGDWPSLPPVSLHPGRGRHLREILRGSGWPGRCEVLEPGGRAVFPARAPLRVPQAGATSRSAPDLA